MRARDQGPTVARQSRSIRRAIALGVLGSTFGAACLPAASGDLVWDVAPSVSVPEAFTECHDFSAIDRGNVYLTYGSVVQAYGGSDGTRLWQSPNPGAGRTTLLAARDGLVFTAGSRPGRVVARAFDGAGGDLLWDIRRAQGDATFDLRGIASDGQVVAVVGTHYVGGPSVPRRRDVYVLALDAATGTILWEDVSNLAGDGDSGAAVLVTRGKVVVAGQEDHAAGSPVDIRLLVRAYAAVSGEVLWQDRSEPGAGWALAARKNQLFALAGDFAHQTSSKVRAYELSGGRFLWSDEAEGSPQSIAAAGKRVFVSRQVGTDFNNSLSMLRAYRRQTGKVLWNAGTTGHLLSRLTASRTRAYGVGTESFLDLLVSVSSARSGNVRWSATFQGEDIDTMGCEALRLPHLLVVVGLTDDEDESSPLLRAYVP